MRLLSYVTPEGPRLGAALGDGRVADLEQAAAAMIGEGKLKAEHALPDGMRAFLAEGEEALASAREVAAYAAEAAGVPWVRPEAQITYAPPVPDPRKIIGIGLNYRDHCAEAGVDIPEQPLVFTKSPTSNVGHGAAVMLHRVTEKVDYEAEIAFVVGKPAKNVPAERGVEVVAGYTCFNDVSARDIQIEQKNFTLGKSPDTFGPNGPYLVTRDEIPDPEGLAISLRLNGQTMQDSNTSNMIFGIGALVAFLSRTMTLEPGDLVFTGTPPGVGYFRDPQVLLKPGDVMEVEIERIGLLRNPVVAEV